MIRFIILLACSLVGRIHATNNFIADLVLYSAALNPGVRIGAIVPGMVINLATTGSELTILAQVNSTVNGYILFKFDDTFTNKESFPFYALNGNSGSYLNPFDPLATIGEHTLVAELYNSRTGRLLDTATLTITVIDTDMNTNNGPLTKFNLVNTVTGNEVTLPSVVDLTKYGESLSILADTRRRSVDDVAFFFDGDFVRVENGSPWALNGNAGTRFFPFPSLTIPGVHTITAVAIGFQEEILGNMTFTFIVQDTDPTEMPSGSPTPSPTNRPTLRAGRPTITPTSISSVVPTQPFATEGPSEQESLEPSSAPVKSPTLSPVSSTEGPSVQESLEPSYMPVKSPTLSPVSSDVPTQPLETEEPTSQPAATSSSEPSSTPSAVPTRALKTATPTPIVIPSNEPSKTPSVAPMSDPTSPPLTATPTFAPVKKPSLAPLSVPSPVTASLSPTSKSINAVISGELRKWHKVTLSFTGPYTSETNFIVNPFMDYRLDVTFTHERTQKRYIVPGYYAADGNAAETSASNGTQWHCHFSPDEIGFWSYDVAFVTGKDVAVNDGGEPSYFDGANGEFEILGSNKMGRDHRGKGRLRYVGAHHLQFAEGEWFLKAGADSPENFLAYEDFDNTPNNGDRRKTWSPHVGDFSPGDPTWQGNKGTGIIGAINYLSREGMNVFSFLTMNIDGDDENVFPYISDLPEDRLRLDVSKLAQWEIVFEHADKIGMYLHFKLAETENDQLLDGGLLGNERKLYYRELIARFSHHLALNWNLSEEISNPVDKITEFADFIKATDPYNHIVLFHTRPNSEIYTEFLGSVSIDGASLQDNPTRVFSNTLRWVQQSAALRRKWIVSNDEQNSANDGVLPDRVDPNHDIIRINSLWGNIMAGGAGVEYYFGYAFEQSDLSLEDFRSRANMWKQSHYALSFFRDNAVPFWEMSNDNSRLPDESTDWVLSSDDGSVLVVYRKTIDTSAINMVGLSGRYSVDWYNPRVGGPLMQGSVDQIIAGGSTPVFYGEAPGADGNDWVVLLRQV